MAVSFSPLSELPVSLQFRMLLGGLDRVEPPGTAMASVYRPIADRVMDFDVREDDVWLLSFPRSGEAWTAEMVWLITNNLDFNRAMDEKFQSRVLWLESPSLEVLPGVQLLKDNLRDLPGLASPRCIKSFLPAELLPRQLWTKRVKIVYVARDLKDVILYYYRNLQAVMGLQSSLEEFTEAFMEDRVAYTPYWKHVLPLWELRHQPNVLFCTYEDTTKDLPAAIRRTAAFLGKTLSEQQVARLAEHLSLDNLQRSATMSGGGLLASLLGPLVPRDPGVFAPEEPGGWRREMTEALAARVDTWARARLKDSDYPCP